MILSWGEAWEIAIAANGHQAMQFVPELTQALTDVALIDPNVIVEIGCATGGTLYAWSKICREVYGITLDECFGPVNDHGTHLFFGDSHADETRSWLTTQLDGKPVDVLFIDGDHSPSGVRADWADYSPLVRPGGLVLFHDVAHTRVEPDVVAFWQEFAPAHDCYVISDLNQLCGPAGFGVVRIPLTQKDS
jgi:hypothetical protein